MSAEKNYDPEKGVNASVLTVSARSDNSNDVPEDVPLFKDSGEVNLVPMPSDDPNGK